MICVCRSFSTFSCGLCSPWESPNEAKDAMATRPSTGGSQGFPAAQSWWFQWPEAMELFCLFDFVCPFVCFTEICVWVVGLYLLLMFLLDRNIVSAVDYLPCPLLIFKHLWFVERDGTSRGEGLWDIDRKGCCTCDSGQARRQAGEYDEIRVESWATFSLGLKVWLDLFGLYTHTKVCAPQLQQGLLHVIKSFTLILVPTCSALALHLAQGEVDGLSRSGWGTCQAEARPSVAMPFLCDYLGVDSLLDALSYMNARASQLLLLLIDRAAKIEIKIQHPKLQRETCRVWDCVKPFFLDFEWFLDFSSLTSIILCHAQKCIYLLLAPAASKAVTLARVACTSRMGAVAAHEVGVDVDLLELFTGCHGAQLLHISQDFHVSHKALGNLLQMICIFFMRKEGRCDSPLRKTCPTAPTGPTAAFTFGAQGTLASVGFTAGSFRGCEGGEGLLCENFNATAFDKIHSQKGPVEQKPLNLKGGWKKHSERKKLNKGKKWRKTPWKMDTVISKY